MRGAAVGGVLAAAATIGFLGGALAATIGGQDAPGPRPVPTVTVQATPREVSAPTLTLVADRAQASVRELIRLSGQLTPALPAVPLQVQQSVDGSGFVDFPVTDQTEDDGSYGMWVRTQRTGLSEFRVVTDLNGQRVVSPSVGVTIG